MNFSDKKHVRLIKLYPYLWLVSLAAQFFLMCDIFGTLKSSVLFIVVTVLQVRYKLLENTIKKISVISIVVSFFLAVMAVFLWSVYPNLYFESGIKNMWLAAVPVLLEILSIGMFVHPVINAGINLVFDDKEFNLKRLGLSFILIMPFYFIMFCYLPVECYLGNTDGFYFPFQSFIFYEIYYFTAFSLITSLVISLLSKSLYKIIQSVILGLDICCYIQYVFLNSKLHLLDGEKMKWEEYSVFSIVTLLIWLAVIVFFIILNVCKTEQFCKISVKVSVGLTALQALSAVIMIVMAGGKIYSRETEHMSGEEQYTVSGSRNVIMFVLDATDNDYFKEILAEEPAAFEGYEDFTLYTNTCSVFDSTPTSMTQMLTGMEFAVELSGEDWYKTAWNSEKANEFFRRFHENNYVINGYNAVYNEQRLAAKLMDNYKRIDSSEFENKVHIDSKGIADEFTVLSVYRMLPFIFKKYIDYERISFDSYVIIDEGAYYYNDDFFRNMTLKKSSNEKNYMIIEHLDGTHPPCTDFTDESKKLLSVIREYMNQLKELGVYNNASIIITADHGRHNEAEPDKAGTPVFMIKRSNVTQSALRVSSAPVYHEDIQATLLDCADLYECAEDENFFGRSVFNIRDDECRERTWYDRRNDENLKSIKCMRSSMFVWEGNNSYYGYTYTGDTSVLEKMVSENKPSNKYQMTDDKG